MSRKDPVTAEVRETVLLRDKQCFLSRLDTEHQCRDLWGWPHRSDDLDKLTIEHVHKQLMMGRRAPSRPAFLVALCGSANVAVPSKSARVEMRAFLAAQYPAEWA